MTRCTSAAAGVPGVKGLKGLYKNLTLLKPFYSISQAFLSVGF
jgi:hypothetical protein